MVCQLLGAMNKILIVPQASDNVFGNSDLSYSMKECNIPIPF